MLQLVISLLRLEKGHDYHTSTALETDLDGRINQNLYEMLRQVKHISIDALLNLAGVKTIRRVEPTV